MLGSLFGCTFRKLVLHQFVSLSVDRKQFSLMLLAMFGELCAILWLPFSPFGNVVCLVHIFLSGEGGLRCFFFNVERHW